MKTANKREIQQTAFNHLLDTVFQEFQHMILTEKLKNISMINWKN